MIVMPERFMNKVIDAPHSVGTYLRNVKVAATSYRITSDVHARTLWLDLKKYLSFCIHFLDIKMQYTLFFGKKCTIK